MVGKAWVDMSRQLMEQVFPDMTIMESWLQVDRDVMMWMCTGWTKVNYRVYQPCP